VRGQDAVRQAQPAHEGVLGRRDIEQTEELVAEDVEPLRETAFGRFGKKLVPHVERMILALRLFFRDELFTGRDKAVLRDTMDVDWAGSITTRGSTAVPRQGVAQERIEVLSLRLGEQGSLGFHASGSLGRIGRSEARRHDLRGRP
jgi:hypothetical protein